MKRPFVQLLWIAAFLPWLAWSCQPAPAGTENDQLLAKVHNKTLYLSELEGMIPESSSSEDSSLIIKAYIERWVREAVMMYEAERNVPKDLNIDKLVRDYRASLIRHNYEKLLVEQLLDSTVTQQELAEFYELNKDQYQLKEPIVRAHFLQIPLSAPDLDKVDKWWKSDDPEDFKLLAAYCNTYATVHLLEDSSWYSLPTLASEWPVNLSVGNLAPGATLSRKDDTFQYYFRLIDHVPEKALAPISYVADQARKAILHKRKMGLLEDTKEQMYERSLRRNEVKIYQ